MQKIDLQLLLDKHKDGTLTREESAMLESWYLKWEPAKLAIDPEELNAIKTEVWQNIVNPPLQIKKTAQWPRVWAAASIIFAFCLFGYYLYNNAGKYISSPVMAARKAAPDFRPGTRRAVLTLSNGSRILLKDAKNGWIAQQGSASVKKLKDGELVYDNHAGQVDRSEAALKFNTMSTPRGGQYNLTLSDGTKVWLNAATSITYPVLFKANERRVTIRGEAYFEVAHDKGRPFKVATGNQEIIVLGTHFNVKAYAEDAAISTTLLKGAIRISNLNSGLSRLMKPGQQANIYKDLPQISLRTVNAEQSISWKEGYFLFDNQDLKSILTILGRWYDVDFEYRNKHSYDRYGGTFSRASNLSETLKNLQQIGNAHFVIRQDKIIVTD